MSSQEEAFDWQVDIHQTELQNDHYLEKYSTFSVRHHVDPRWMMISRYYHLNPPVPLLSFLTFSCSSFLQSLYISIMSAHLSLSPVSIHFRLFCISHAQAV